MSEKTLIIHPGTIEHEIAYNTGLSAGEIEAGQGALDLIARTIQAAENLVITDNLAMGVDGRIESPVLDGDVYLLVQDDLGVTRDCVKEGDQATIMGAYANVCGAIVQDILAEMDVESELDEVGAWTIPGVRQRAICLNTK